MNCLVLVKFQVSTACRALWKFLLLIQNESRECVIRTASFNVTGRGSD